MSRRKYKASFKLNAIKLSEEKNNVAQEARELGIKAPMIHRWKKNQEEYQNKTFNEKVKDWSGSLHMQFRFQGQAGQNQYSMFTKKCYDH